MTILIEQIRAALPFGMPENEICAGVCIGCPKKLMEYITCQVEHWECKLNNQEIPSLADISDLARISKKVHRSMAKNNLV